MIEINMATTRICDTVSNKFNAVGRRSPLVSLII